MDDEDDEDDKNEQDEEIFKVESSQLTYLVTLGTRYRTVDKVCVGIRGPKSCFLSPHTPLI